MVARRGSRRALIVLAVPLLAFVAFAVFATTASATKPPDHKITICHATDSYTNPYVVITVDVASVQFAGHQGHDGPIFFPDIPKHEKWGDIIPPTSNDGTRPVTPKNWTPLGQSIWANGCRVPSAVTTTVPRETTTTPGGATTTAPGETTTIPGGATTTAPGETTTIPGGATTTAPGGSTTMPPTTIASTTTSTLGGQAGIHTTTSIAVSAEAVVSNPTSVAVDAESLPHTGSNSMLVTLVALVIALTGAALIGGSARRVKR